MFSKRSDQPDQADAGTTSAPSGMGVKPTTNIGGGQLSRSVIQSDLVIKGAILARGELELNGLVEGDVIARSVVVGPSATILGDILGERVSISGSVQGQVSGHQVHLGAGARYEGNIRRGVLAIDEGAQFEGSVKALDEQGKREIAQRLEAAAPSKDQNRQAVQQAQAQARSAAR